MPDRQEDQGVGEAALVAYRAVQVVWWVLVAGLVGAVAGMLAAGAIVRSWRS